MMRFLSTTRQRCAAAAVALTVAGGASAAVVSGASASGASTSGSAPKIVMTGSATARHQAGGSLYRLLRRADYASLQVKRHGHWVTYVVSRGQVKADTPSTLTISRPDGVTVTVKLSPSTRYKGISGESGLEIGKRAAVISVGGTAVRVHQKVTHNATPTA